MDVSGILELVTGAGASGLDSIVAIDGLLAADVGNIVDYYAKAFSAGAIDEMTRRRLTEQLLSDVGSTLRNVSAQTEPDSVTHDAGTDQGGRDTEQRTANVAAEVPRLIAEPSEFKAGTWPKKVTGKRIVMDKLHEKSKYIIGFGGTDTPTGITRRKNEMNSVSVGDILHMKDNQSHYKGIVRSLFTDISIEEMNTEYREITDASWGGPCNASAEFKGCDVVWTRQPLTQEMGLYLNKLSGKGGGCMKQCGTLIGLA